MARKRKTDRSASGADAELPGEGHTSELNDAELRTLAFQHRDAYRKALEAKKAADAHFKNACKAAKTEIGDGAVEIIKDLIALEEPEGEDKMRETLRNKATALRWAGLPLGDQLDFDLGTPDRMPAVDRAFEEGKKQSAEGKPMKPPYDPVTPQYRAFADGYAEHQSELLGQVGRGQ